LNESKNENYNGNIFQDGVDRMIKIIENSEEPITLIAIGPLTNIAAAIIKSPKITEKLRFVAMHGSVYKGYHGSSKVCCEHNTKMDIESARLVFKTKFQHGFVITPLDTSSLVFLKGNKLKKLQESKKESLLHLLEANRLWQISKKKIDINEKVNNTSALFDTVAIYLALHSEHLIIEKKKVFIDSNGIIIVDDNHKDSNEIEIALNWSNLTGYLDWLTGNLLK